MLNLNDLNSYVIYDDTKKYDKINQIIIEEAKNYYKTMKNHSYQITQIENKLNEYNIKSHINIKELLQRQQNIIKELVNIINHLLSSCLTTDNNIIRNNNKNGNSSIVKNKKNKNDKNINNFKVNTHLNNSIDKSQILLLKNSKLNIKNYFKNKNFNKPINSVDRNLHKRNNRKSITNKNIIPLNIVSLKSINDLKYNPDSININFFDNNNKFEKKYLNKQQIKKEIEISNKKLFKSGSSSEISNKTKINKNNLYIKTNDFGDGEQFYRNYTIDEEGNNLFFNYDQEKQSSLYNRTEIDGNLPNLLSKPKIIKKTKYRSAKKIPLKEEYYLINNYTFTNFNFTNSTSNKSTGNLNNRNNSSTTVMNSNVNRILKNNNNNSQKKFEKQIYTMPYINNGIQIIPTRITKEVLSSSYKVLNKYKNKRNKK